MKPTTLEAYVQQKKQERIDKYGKLSGEWYDRGVAWAIQEYVSMTGGFTKADVEFLKRTEFEPEYFLDDIEEDY
jgi:hypothetical protein